MAAAVIGLLLAASLPQPGASFGAADAKALLKELDPVRKVSLLHSRRLTGGNETDEAPFTAECLAACGDLMDMLTGVGNAQMELEAKENPNPWDGDKLMMDMFCQYKDAAACFVAADACNTSDAKATFDMYTDKLSCLCGTCPKAKVVWAKMMQMGNGDGDEEGPNDGRRLATTVEDVTTTVEDSRRMMMDTTVEDEEVTDEQMCMMYSLGSCVVDYPEECKVLDDTMGVKQFHEGLLGTMMKELCTGDLDPEKIADDGNTDDDAGDVVGSCGPVGLGWFAASVPVMAALQFMAA